MAVLLVILMLLAFVGIDYLVRSADRRLRRKRELAEREAILKVAVRLDISDEARSLKRAEVPNPKGRILAVDDEAVVLDSFRRILVLEGYSVDTVESGPEALNLVQRNDYDFVFTDLKMPGMDGVEVVKAVKHLRPDVDMAVITGYGTIETAVQTMQHGACDFVQKPFTPDELGAFVQKLHIKRQARLEAEQLPAVRVVSPSQAENAPGNVYCVPGGSFLSPNHVWVRIELNGQIRLGVDDFIRKALGKVDRIDLPRPGQDAKRGEPLFTLRLGTQEVRFASPLTGKVIVDNAALREDPELAMRSPYQDGWVCRLEPSDLAAELTALRIGEPVVAWYTEEIARLREAAPAAGQSLAWSDFEARFLRDA
jgi:CheY-like chemotaxis protein